MIHVEPTSFFICILLTQELISTKLKLAESETEKGATVKFSRQNNQAYYPLQAATSKNTIEKLQGTISDYISLSTDLQVAVQLLFPYSE